MSKSKQFMPTYLMVKTHTVTGLKYFCKTTKNNPHSYAGSGTYWKRHLKEYGYFFTTEIIGHYTNENDCKNKAIEFSINNDIVNAIDQSGNKLWANLIIENGLDGGKTREGPRSIEVVEKVKKSILNFWANATQEHRQRARNNGKINGSKSRKRKKGEWHQSDAAKKKLKDINTGKKQSQKTVEKRANSNRGQQRLDNKLVNIQTGIKKYWDDIRNLPIDIQEEKAKDRSNRAKKAKIDYPITPDQIEKIKKARAKQENVFPLGEFLKGKVIVIDKKGNKSVISKEQYYNQQGPKENWEYLSHKHKLAKQRKI